MIGALHYETQVAEAAAEAVGLGGLSASQMTAKAFTTIALLMSVCIMWGMVFSLFTCKRYTARLSNPAPKKKKEGKGPALAGFGDLAMTAMFIGLVSAYLGSYVGTLVSGGGFLPLAVALVGAAAMGLFIWLREKKNAAWIDSFSVAGSMLIAMTAAIFLGKLG